MAFGGAEADYGPLHFGAGGLGTVPFGEVHQKIAREGRSKKQTCDTESTKMEEETWKTSDSAISCSQILQSTPWERLQAKCDAHMQMITDSPKNNYKEMLLSVLWVQCSGAG